MLLLVTMSQHNGLPAKNLTIIILQLMIVIDQAIILQLLGTSLSQVSTIKRCCINYW